MDPKTRGRLQALLLAVQQDVQQETDIGRLKMMLEKYDELERLLVRCEEVLRELEAYRSVEKETINGDE